MQMKFNNSEVQMGFNAYFENFNFHFLLILRMVEFHLHLFSRVFKIWQWFLVQKKAEYSYFEMEKFFTPLTSFLPPLFYVENSLKIDFEHSKHLIFKPKKGGKKFLHLKVWIFSFLLHQESLPYLKNSWI